MAMVDTHNNLETVEDLIARAGFSRDALEKIFHAEVDLSDFESYSGAQLEAYEAFIELSNSDQSKLQSFFNDIRLESDADTIEIVAGNNLEGSLPEIK